MCIRDSTIPILTVKSFSYLAKGTLFYKLRLAREAVARQNLAIFAMLHYRVDRWRPFTLNWSHGPAHFEFCSGAYAGAWDDPLQWLWFKPEPWLLEGLRQLYQHLEPAFEPKQSLVVLSTLDWQLWSMKNKCSQQKRLYNNVVSVWWRHKLKVHGKYHDEIQNYQNAGKLNACASSLYQALLIFLHPTHREPGNKASNIAIHNFIQYSIYLWV